MPMPFYPPKPSSLSFLTAPSLYDAVYRLTHVGILKALSSGSQLVSPDPLSKPLFPKFTDIMSQSCSKVIIMEQQQ